MLCKWEKGSLICSVSCAGIGVEGLNTRREDGTQKSADSTAIMKQQMLLRTLALLSTHLCRSIAQPNRIETGTVPVLAHNFPDPALIEVNGSWYAFATSGKGKNSQVAISPSFTDHDWKLLNETDPLPDPGPWATNENVWAPDVIQLVGYVNFWSVTVLTESRRMVVGSCTTPGNQK